MRFLILGVLLISLTFSLSKLPLYIGKGYNLLKANPLSSLGVDPGFNHQIFQFTYNTQQKTEDGKFLIPDNVSNRKTTACSFSTTINQFRGTQSYQSDLKTKASIGGGYNGALVKASFSLSTTYQKINTQTIKENMTITHASAQCQSYQMSINLFKVNKITDNFWYGLESSYRSNSWDSFIEQFGTHFVFETVLGGRAVQQITYDWKSVSKLESLNVDINLSAKASYAKFFADTSFDYHKYEEQTKYTESLSRSTTELYIGGKPPVNGNISQWQEKIIEDPMPINYKVLPLSDLFQFYVGTNINVTQAKNMFYTALDKYCVEKNCKPPQPDNPKPPAPKIQTSKSYPFGGKGGHDYSWSHVHPTINLKKIILRTGSEIDRIQLLLSDGITSVYTPEFGGNGGGSKDWTVPDKQYITQVEYRSGDRIDSLCFITNKGTKSPKFGGSGGTYHLLTLPTDCRIIGIYGRCGSRVDQLGFELAKTVFPTGEIEIIKKNLIVEQ